MTTTTSPITAEVIREAIDGIDAIVRAELYPDYQGRGMSKPCVGVVVPDARDLLALGASIAYAIAQNVQMPNGERANFWDMGQEDVVEAIDDAIGPLHRAQVDNLGTDLIVYWPGIVADQPTEETQR